MNFKPRFHWLVIAGVMLIISFHAAAGIEPRLIHCLQIKTDRERLSCYDNLAKELTVSEDHYIQPPQEFLDSQLRVTPEESDFDLTIDQFIQLVKSAKLENGQPVVINGWTTQDQGYVLSIQMKSTIQLLFVFDPDKNREFSVLQPVEVKGIKMDPTLFVMNMAARTM